MKALIFSDSHGFVGAMAEACEAFPDAEYIIFAGDMQRDIEELMKMFPQKNFIYILGNNDYFVSGVPYEKVFTLEGKTVFLTHGHKYGVKMGLSSISFAAREKGADICIFGHTHSKLLEEANGITFFNPGSAMSSCGLLEIKGGKFEFKFI